VGGTTRHTRISPSMPWNFPAEFFMRVCLVVPPTFIIYDTLLTFSREIDCIWKRKSGAVTLLFISQRYCMMFLTILRMIVPTEMTACKAWNYMQFISALLSAFGVGIFATLRTWAICGRFNMLVILVFLCNMIDPAMNIYNFSRPKLFRVDPVRGCMMGIVVSPHDQYLPTVTRVSAIVADLLVLVITWWKTADVWKASKQMKQFKPKLSMLLLRDGTIYFVALFLLNFVTLLLDVLARVNVDLKGSSYFSYVTEAFGPALVARFLLDLRSTAEISPPDHSGEMTTINFAGTSIVGDLAAPLGPDSTWLTSAAGDVEYEPNNKSEGSSGTLALAVTDDSEFAGSELRLDDLRFTESGHRLPSS